MDMANDIEKVLNICGYDYSGVVLRIPEPGEKLPWPTEH